MPGQNVVRGDKVIVLAMRQRADHGILVGPVGERGRCSQTCKPGTLVAMGLNSPRISGGASGFRSNVSRWLAPPVRKTMMTDFGLFPGRALGALGEQGRKTEAEQAGAADLKQLRR